jgi:hypothetical protein
MHLFCVADFQHAIQAMQAARAQIEVSNERMNSNANGVP